MLADCSPLEALWRLFVIIGWKRVIVPRGDDIGAGEPAIEIDIGAAFRAERFEFFYHWLAADRALAFTCHQTPERLD